MTRHDNVDAAALAGCNASLLRSTQLAGADVMPPQVTCDPSRNAIVLPCHDLAPRTGAVTEMPGALPAGSTIFLHRNPHACTRGTFNSSAA